jgi:hypothetical protein
MAGSTRAARQAGTLQAMAGKPPLESTLTHRDGLSGHNSAAKRVRPGRNMLLTGDLAKADPWLASCVNFLCPHEHDVSRSSGNRPAGDGRGGSLSPRGPTGRLPRLSTGKPVTRKGVTEMRKVFMVFAAALIAWPIFAGQKPPPTPVGSRQSPSGPRDSGSGLRCGKLAVTATPVSNRLVPQTDPPTVPAEGKPVKQQQKAELPARSSVSQTQPLPS